VFTTIIAVVALIVGVLAWTSSLYCATEKTVYQTARMIEKRVESLEEELRDLQYRLDTVQEAQ
jgi:hypothetical protein